MRSLYQAVDAYTAQVERSASRSVAWREELRRRVNKIKDVLADLPLERFGRDAIAEVVDSHVAAAEKGEIAVDTGLDYIRAMRQFVDWLDATDVPNALSSPWRQPEWT